MNQSEFLKIERSSVVNKSFRWMPADTEKNYEKVRRQMDIPYGPYDITYKYNNYGFRCDDFDSWENHPYRVLFAGCSMTEGIGVPLEDLWAKRLHKKICKKLEMKIPYWTVASGGTGIDHMVRYLYNIKDLLKPQVVISILPNEVRRERWHEDRWSIWSLGLTGEEHTEFLTEDNFVAYQTEKNLCMLNTLLEELDSQLLFTTNSNIDTFNLDRLTKMDLFVEPVDFGRDGIHAGPKTNKLIAEQAFDYCWPTIEQRLTTIK